MIGTVSTFNLCNCLALNMAPGSFFSNRLVRFAVMGWVCCLCLGCGKDPTEVEALLEQRYGKDFRATTFACVSVAQHVTRHNKGVIDSFDRCKLEDLERIAAKGPQIRRGGARTGPFVVVIDPIDVQNVLQGFWLLKFARPDDLEHRTFNGMGPSDARTSDWVESRYKDIQNHSPVIFALSSETCRKAFKGGVEAFFETHDNKPPGEAMRGHIGLCKSGLDNPFVSAYLLTHEVQHLKAPHALVDVLFGKGEGDVFWLNPLNAGGYNAELAIQAWMIKRLNPDVVVNDYRLACKFGRLINDFYTQMCEHFFKPDIKDGVFIKQQHWETAKRLWGLDIRNMGDETKHPGPDLLINGKSWSNVTFTKKDLDEVVYHLPAYCQKHTKGVLDIRPKAIDCKTMLAYRDYIEQNELLAMESAEPVCHVYRHLMFEVDRREKCGAAAKEVEEARNELNYLVGSFYQADCGLQVTEKVEIIEKPKSSRKAFSSILDVWMRFF